MNDTRDIVGRYHEAWERKDFAAARGYLRDDLSFSGPIDTFDNADDYVAALQRLGQMVEGVDSQGMVVEGEDAVVFFELITPLGRSPVAEWYRVRDGKIAEVRVYFDARPFAPPA